MGGDNLFGVFQNPGGSKQHVQSCDLNVKYERTLAVTIKKNTLNVSHL